MTKTIKLLIINNKEQAFLTLTIVKMSAITKLSKAKPNSRRPNLRSWFTFYLRDFISLIRSN